MIQRSSPRNGAESSEITDPLLRSASGQRTSHVTVSINGGHGALNRERKPVNGGGPSRSCVAINRGNAPTNRGNAHKNRRTAAINSGAVAINRSTAAMNRSSAAINRSSAATKGGIPGSPILRRGRRVAHGTA
eukprot:712404-Rhodomonas_salina.1